MSKLFEGPLRPYFQLWPSLSLEKNQVFLEIQSQASSGKTSIQYRSTQPVRLKKEYPVHYKRARSAHLPSLCQAMGWAWSVQIGLGAIQKALGRHELSRMSRTNKIRLVVCLVVLLKFLSEAKNDGPHTAAPGFPLLTPQEASSNESISHPWNSMRNHLLDAITWHLRQLSLRCFPPTTSLNQCFVKYSDGLFATYSIFPAIEAELAQLLDKKFINEPSETRPWLGADILKAERAALSTLQPDGLESDNPKEVPYYDQLSIAFAGHKLENDTLTECDHTFTTGDPWFWCETCDDAERQNTSTTTAYVSPVLCSHCYRSDDHTGHEVKRCTGGREEHIKCGSARPLDRGPTKLIDVLDVDEPKSPEPTFIELDKTWCGYSFLDGDLIWRCYTCEQVDGRLAANILCQICFIFDDHEGHSFEATEAILGDGALCDCGSLGSCETNEENSQQPCWHRIDK
jgi:hypothetical protein